MPATLIIRISVDRAGLGCLLPAIALKIWLILKHRIRHHKQKGAGFQILGLRITPQPFLGLKMQCPTRHICARAAQSR